MLIALVFSNEYVFARFGFVSTVAGRSMLSKILPPIAPTSRTEPVRDLRSLELETVEGGRVEVEIPSDYIFFRGHFDGAPILPGVVQLTELVLPIARSQHPRLGSLTKLRRVRFKRPIFPGERVTVHVSAVDAAPLDMQFELRVGDALIANGSMTFDAALQP